MTAPLLRLGTVFVASFPEHAPGGHEQEGLRPAVVVGLPTQVGRPRFPVLLLAPMTTFRRQAWVSAAPDLYPVLPGGAAGLPSDSVILLDQTRALDVARLRRWLGQLSASEYAPLSQALRRMGEP